MLTFTKFQDRNVSMQCPMPASVLAGCVLADFLHCLPSAAAAAAAAKTQQRRSDAPLEDSDPHQRRCTMRRYDTRRYFNVRSPRATFPTSGSSYFNVHSLPRIIWMMSRVVRNYQTGKLTSACSGLWKTWIMNENVPIQLAQCRFPGMAISSAKILIYF